jgi:hypothetical protein
VLRFLGFCDTVLGGTSSAIPVLECRKTASIVSSLQRSHALNRRAGKDAVGPESKAGAMMMRKVHSDPSGALSVIDPTTPKSMRERVAHFERKSQCWITI